MIRVQKKQSMVLLEENFVSKKRGREFRFFFRLFVIFPGTVSFCLLRRSLEPSNTCDKIPPKTGHM